MKRLPQWLEHTELLIPPLPWDRPRWQPGEHTPVILLHGLWRGWRAMQPMARALQHAGFPTLNLTYPSSRKSIPDLVDHISRILEPLTGDRPVHVVTHSLGGIIARSALAESKWNIDRMVMIAPPSNGSEIVDFLESAPLLHRCLGPAGRQLGSRGTPFTLPSLPDHVESAVIMGNQDSVKCFKRLLETENDGVVSTHRGKIPGLTRFAVVQAGHTFIPAHPETKRLSIEFLQTGDWKDRSPTAD